VAARSCFEEAANFIDCHASPRGKAGARNARLPVLKSPVPPRPPPEHCGGSISAGPAAVFRPSRGLRTRTCAWPLAEFRRNRRTLLQWWLSRWTSL